MTHDPPLNSDPKIPNSGLVQKLQRRVVESAGVINVRQLPVQKTFITLSRMVERENLPTQIQSRYEAVGRVQPLELPGRSRVESLDRVMPDRGNPLLQRLQQVPLLMPKTMPETMPKTIPVASVPAELSDASSVIAPRTTGTFRVSRKLASEVSDLPMADPLPANPEPSGPQDRFSSGTTASEVTSGATSEVTSGGTFGAIASPEPMRVRSPQAQVLQAQSGSDRGMVIARKPTQAMPEAQRIRPIQPSSNSGTESIQAHTKSSEVDRSPDVPPHVSDGPREMGMGNAVPVARAEISPIQSLPLAIARMPVEAAAPMASAVPIAGEMGLEPTRPVAVGEGSREMGRSPTVPITPVATTLPLAIARVPAEPPSPALVKGEIILQPKSFSSAEVPMATSFAAQPLPPQSPVGFLTNTPIRIAMAPSSLGSFSSGSSSLDSASMTQPRVQLSPEPGSQTGAAIARVPLPLHSQPILGAIARQTESPVVVESPPIPATPPPPPPETQPTNPEIDVKQIAEQVSRLLLRQLTVERERQGRQPW